jgi:hypothetical protein
VSAYDLAVQPAFARDQSRALFGQTMGLVGHRGPLRRGRIPRARPVLRRTQDIRAAPLLAASIFLDVLNVFLLLLNLFNRN